MSLPVVAVVGRPNVGKSTFFNRAVGERAAIVDDTPGVTRDRNFGRAEWTGRPFFVVDTGGVVEGSNRGMDRLIREQAMTAVQEADQVVFLVDSTTGVHPLDQRLADVLRRTAKPVLLAVNKVDDLPHGDGHLEFWSMGMGRPRPMSAASGRGVGDLLDAVVAGFPPSSEAAPPDGLRVAVVGKPNAGKSSFVNRLLGEERVLVSEQAGTTRDPVDHVMRYHGRDLVFVDTAGLRRHARIRDAVEYYASLRTARVVRDSEVCLVLVDGAEGLHGQDVKVAEAAWSAGCGVVLVCNKWDLVEKETRTAQEFSADARRRAPFLKDVPFLFASARTGLRIRKALDLVLDVARRRRRRIPTHEVNEAVEALARRQPPPHARGRAVRLKYATQAETAPPTFVVFSNRPDGIPAHYRRYIANFLRARWDFAGVPVRVRLRKSGE